MKKYVFLICFLLMASFVQGQVKIPDTPAGNVLKEMLEAFNSKLWLKELNGDLTRCHILYLFN